MDWGFILSLVGCGAVIAGCGAAFAWFERRERERRTFSYLRAIAMIEQAHGPKAACDVVRAMAQLDR